MEEARASTSALREERARCRGDRGCHVRALARRRGVRINVPESASFELPSSSRGKPPYPWKTGQPYCQRLRAMPLHSLSEIALVAVMSKPHCRRQSWRLEGMFASAAPTQIPRISSNTNPSPGGLIGPDGQHRQINGRLIIT